jgi:Flp pilus assembly protein TadD
MMNDEWKTGALHSSFSIPHSSFPHFARLSIILVTLIAFSPAFRNDFGGWDDAMNLTQNPDFNPPTVSSIAKYWRAPAFDLYAPLTFTIWGFIASVAFHPTGLSPLPFHLANLLLHVGAALTVFELLRRLTASIFASAIASIFFAIHPSQVEAVAWVSGLKDVLAGLLAMLAILSHVRGKFALACVMFVAATLAKSSAMVVPPIAVLLDVAVNQRRIGAALRRGWPMILLAVPIMLIARHAQPAHQIGALPLHGYVLVALDSLTFYFWKLIWPLRLGVDYGRRPEIVVDRGWTMLTWLPPLIIAGIAIFAWKRGVRWPAVALAVLVIGVAPVLGLVAFDFQAYSTVADHYLYIAMLGPAIAVARMLCLHDRPVSRLAGVCVCCILCVLSFTQALTWHDAASISEQALRANPNSWASHQQLARLALDRDGPQTALRHARRATELNPYYATSFETLGEACARVGTVADAEAAFREAIRLAPHDARAHVELANLLANQNRRTEAIDEYLAALAINPRDVISLTNLAGVYAELRDFDQAIHFYDAALSIDRNFAPARAGRQRAALEKKQY